MMLEPLNAGDEPMVIEECLCVTCGGGKGQTRLLPTKIPFFRELIISSFECPDCDSKNAAVQFAGAFGAQGTEIRLEVVSDEDLNRQLVKSDFATLKIPELELEIPPSTGKGVMTTVEGVLERIAGDLTLGLEEREPGAAGQIRTFLTRVASMRTLATSFNIILDDPSGNSFIENPKAPANDPHLHTRKYTRTAKQTEALGLATSETDVANDPEPSDDPLEEVHQIPVDCPSCAAQTFVNMKYTQIPNFKAVILMCTTCDACGYRSTEVKSGAGISDHGLKYTLSIEKPEDLARDVIRSHSSSLSIPELEFTSSSEASGGKYTTVEGVIKDILVELGDENPFLVSGDSRPDGSGISGQIDKFKDQLKDILSLKLPAHLVIDDIAGNSYIQDICLPEPDPRLKSEQYERTHEDNEGLGLNDMQTEGYEDLSNK